MKVFQVTISGIVVVPDAASSDPTDWPMDTIVEEMQRNPTSCEAVPLEAYYHGAAEWRAAAAVPITEPPPTTPREPTPPGDDYRAPGSYTRIRASRKRRGMDAVEWKYRSNAYMKAARSCGAGTVGTCGGVKVVWLTDAEIPIVRELNRTKDEETLARSNGVTAGAHPPKDDGGAT